MQLIFYFQEMWRLAIQGQAQGIWFWAGVYTFMVCIYSLIFQLRTRSWPFVPGELAKLGIEKLGATDWVLSKQDYRSSALYTYQVAGVTYAGKRISPWIFVASHNARIVLQKQMSGIARFADGRVKVFYNPARPKKSYLVVAGKIGIFITWLVAVIPLVSYYFKYHV